MKTSEGEKVWILSVSYKTREHASCGMPLVEKNEHIPFSSTDNLFKHLCGLILKFDSERFDPEYYSSFKHAIGMQRHEYAVGIWRSAQLDNKTPFNLDAYWDESPQVVL
jgi:hypothetical protein